MEGHGEISTGAFRIGDFTIIPSRNLVVKDSQSFNLEPRIMDVLCVLAAQPRDVVSRDALIENVWNVEYGADESLTRAISILRKTFRSAGATQEFIQTIPKRGYRLVMNVPEVVEVPQTVPSTFSSKTTLQGAQEIAAENNEKLAPVALPAKMVEADISGFVPNDDALPPAKKLKNHIIVLSIVPLIILGITVASFWLKPEKQLGTALSIEQYGRSVAVLSLADMSAESDLEYFVDGMAEEILSVLTQVPDLHVAGRTSSFAYKGKNMKIRDIGTALKVSHIIDGSVRKQGEQVKITIRLNNTSNGAQVWSKTYNGTLQNVFTLQEEISQDIIINLELLLGINVKPLIAIDL